MATPPRVLIVDDDREIVQAARFRLEAAGYDVITARDGHSGMAVVLKTPLDAIVLDIRMPVLDGFTVLSRLRQQSDTKDIPIVMLSANVAETAKRRALDLGATYFLEKPYDGPTLLQAVRCALAGRRAGDAP